MEWREVLNGGTGGYKRGAGGGRNERRAIFRRHLNLQPAMSGSQNDE